MFYPKMCFVRNRSSYSFETCTIVIGMPENLRVHRVWSSKYKGEVMFYPKMCFVRNRSSYSFETCTIVIGMPENLRVHGVWSSKYKEESDILFHNCVLSETDHHTALKLVPLWLACLKTSGCMEIDHAKYKGKWCFMTKMCFVRNRSSYSFETCTIVIGMPENLKVHGVWSSKYKGEVMFYPKMCFVRNRSSYSFETCNIVIGMPENLRVHGVLPF